MMAEAVPAPNGRKKPTADSVATGMPRGAKTRVDAWLAPMGGGRSWRWRSARMKWLQRASRRARSRLPPWRWCSRVARERGPGGHMTRSDHTCVQSREVAGSARATSARAGDEAPPKHARTVGATPLRSSVATQRKDERIAGDLLFLFLHHEGEDGCPGGFAGASPPRWRRPPNWPSWMRGAARPAWRMAVESPVKETESSTAFRTLKKAYEAGA